MSGHVKLTVNGEVRIDGNLGDWDSNPPPMLTDTLKAGAKAAPWMRAALMPVADAASRAAATQAGMRLPPLTGGYTIRVQHTDGNTDITVTTH